MVLEVWSNDKTFSSLRLCGSSTPNTGNTGAGVCKLSEDIFTDFKLCVGVLYTPPALPLSETKTKDPRDGVGGSCKAKDERRRVYADVYTHV